MTLSDKIQQLPFFKRRTVIDSLKEDKVALIGFKENENDVYSSLVASPKSASGVIPHAVFICSGGCLVRLDSGEQTITVAMDAKGDTDAFTEVFSISSDEGEYFQSSLVHNYGYITYEYFDVLKQVLVLMDE